MQDGWVKRSLDAHGAEELLVVDLSIVVLVALLYDRVHALVGHYAALRKNASDFTGGQPPTFVLVQLLEHKLEVHLILQQR